MNNAKKKHASTPKYVSPNQLVLDGFSTSFEKALNPENRWVVFSSLILNKFILSQYYPAWRRILRHWKPNWINSER